MDRAVPGAPSPGFAEAMDGDAKLAPRGAERRPVGSFRADDDVEEAIRRRCAQYFDPVGTCRMGAPEIVPCNTNATAIMIAEKAAEMLARG